MSALMPASHSLRRVFGLGFGLAVIVGSTIGTGILRAPGLVAGQLHSPTSILAAWVIGGLYTLLGSICLTELGAAIPGAGGYFVYARRAFGDVAGFAVGWTDWLTYCCVLGYVSITLAEFVVRLAPELAGMETKLAIGALVVFVALQFAGVKVSGAFQEITTAVKFAAFLALVIACLVWPLPAATAATTASAMGVSLAGMIGALQAVVITYGGWQSALYFTEEDRDPGHNLPRAMIGGVAAVIFIYFLVNVALLAVLPIPDLAASTLPAADAASRLVGTRGGVILTMLSIVSLVPLLNAVLMIGTRILFGMGRDGLFWSKTSEVGAAGTPVVATLTTTAVGVVLIATGTFKQLIATTSFFLAANYSVSCLALITLRRREPGLARPFRAWGYPASAWIVLIGAIAFLGGVIVGDTRNGLAAIGLMAVGVIGYVAIRATNITMKT
jgi:APA family basic amino acid/polyamine antiporter